jgi:hypothetical protein
LADIAIIEDHSILPAPAQENTQALVRRFFQGLKYNLLLRHPPFLVFARQVTFERFFICNTLVVAIAEDSTAVEELLPRLENECRNLRRLLLLGRPLHVDFLSKEYYFMTLRKDYTQRGYTYQGKPLGFHLRPLILIEGSEQWDYFMGPTMRIDSLPLDAQALAVYVDRQVEAISANQSRLLNRKKYYLWKSSSLLLKYGHYPLLGLWVAKLLTEIVQHPFPLKLPGLIALTALLYGTFIGFVWLSHTYFKRSRIRELTASTKSESSTPQYQTRTQPIQQERHPLSREVVIAQQDEGPERKLAEVPVKMLNHEPQIIPEEFVTPVHSPKLVIAQAMPQILNIQESAPLISASRDLFQTIFLLLLEESQQPLMPHDHLTDLLKKTRHNEVVQKYFNPLSLWVRKLETQTPFTPLEIREFKKFLLLFLLDLNLLPAFLRDAITARIKGKDKVVPKQDITQSTPPLPNPLPLDVASLQTETKAQDPKDELPLPPLTAENLEVENIPLSLHVAISGINAAHLQKMREDERSGIYTVLLMEMADLDSQAIIERFISSSEDLPKRGITRNYMNVSELRDSLLQAEFGEVETPAVMLGCGKSTQIIPYGGKDDDAQFHRVLDEYQRAPRCMISLKDRTGGKDSDPAEKPVAKALAERASPPDLVEEAEEADIFEMERPAQQPVVQNVEKPPEKVEPSLQLPPTPLAELPPVLIPPSSDSYRIQTKQIQDHLFIKNNLVHFQKGSVMIDGNNVAHLLKDQRHDNSGPLLACVEATIQKLVDLGFPREIIMVFFDGNIVNKLHPREAERVFQYQREGFVKIMTAQIRADEYMVQVAEQNLHRKFIVISKDTFKNEPPWFRQHRIPIMLDLEDSPILVFRSVEDLLHTFHGLERPKLEGDVKSDA